MERSKKPTEEQKEALLDYMEMHVEFACDRFESADGASLRQERWKELAQMLNSVAGPVKDPQKWRKFWTDQKLHVKERQALLNASINKSGINGIKILKPLSAFKSRISALLIPAAVSGNEDVREVFATTTTKFTEPEYLWNEYQDEELEEVQHAESSTAKEQLAAAQRNNTAEITMGPKVAMTRKRKRAPSGRSYENHDFEAEFIEVERKKLGINTKIYELEVKKFEWQKEKEKKELELRERELEIRKMQSHLCP